MHQRGLLRPISAIRSDARLVEEQMQLGDLGAHFQVGEVLLLEIVGQCRQCIVLPEAGFVNINQVFA